MEGNGGAGASATPWDLGMHWAPATSAYQHHPFLPPTGGPSQQQQMQQELTCLKLGKRPCCWGGGGQVAQGEAGPVHGSGGGGAAAEGKRKEKAEAAAAAAVPRCQVEGCQVVLAGAKEYHRRHKVCEAHSKAPRVIVHGAEQRFCQQCSRFHAISEFDDAKRSCRRRLAGHNERRRKSNASENMVRASAHPHGITSMLHGFPPYGALPTSPAGALSLLSSARAAPWLIPTADISARSSAALDELIAENRAALLSWHFFPDRSAGRPAPQGRVPDETTVWHAHLLAQQAQAPPAGHPHAGNAVGRYPQEAPAGHVTLDLMQATNTTTGAPLRPVPDRPAPARPAKDGDAGCSSDVWTSSEEARVV